MKEEDKEDAPKKVRPSVLAGVMAKLEAGMGSVRLQTLHSPVEGVSSDTRVATSIRGAFYNGTFVHHW